jgi:O-antigen/teichoic acid export membrane protein
VGRVSSRGDFSEYRKSISWRAIGSLLVIPLSVALGLLGWFIGTLAAATLTLARLGKRLTQPLGSAELSLVKNHWKEGLQLALINVLWLQLLNFARLYASFAYPPETIATYGILASAYQSLSALLISLFLPVSVGILGRYGESEAHARTYARHILQRVVPWVMAATCMAIFAAPPLLHLCFPSYQFDIVSLRLIFLSLLFQPFLIVWGNLLVAAKRTTLYLVLMVTGLGIGTLTASSNLAHGAAWGQWAGIATYTSLLCIAVHRHLRHREALYLAAVIMLCALVIWLGSGG